jgi:hypothetical protein
MSIELMGIELMSIEGLNVCVVCIPLMTMIYLAKIQKRRNAKRSAYLFLALFVVALCGVMYKGGMGLLILEFITILFALVLITVTAIKKTFPKILFYITLFMAILSNLKSCMTISYAIDYAHHLGLDPTKQDFSLIIFSWLSFIMLGLYRQCGFKREFENEY